MTSRRLGLLLAGAVVLIGAVTGVVIIASSGDDEPSGLPDVVSRDAPTAYRVLYQVTTPDGSSTEEHVVHRPFGARITTRDADGDVTSERWSDLGVLITRSQGADAVAINTAVAPAASDLRPEHYAEPLVAAERLVDAGRAEVGGRACTLYAERGTVATDPGDGEERPAVGDTGTVPVTVDRCVDAQGIVLEERYTTEGGQRAVTKRAIELELDDDVLAIELPDADPLPAEQGNGAIEEIDADEPPPFGEAFELPNPDGFRYVGRYAVVPPQLGTGAGAAPAEPDTALYTDVWRRGPDLLLFDQGASQTGRAPFDPRTALEEVDLGGLGTATLAGDLRSAEVRLTRADGGFVRLAGTVSFDELLALARTITAVEVAPS